MAMNLRVGLRVWMGHCAVGAGLGLLVLAGPARAGAQDAPLRAARLTFVQGSVTVDRMDNTGRDAAVLNMPLAGGVRLTAGQDGQAEIEFEDGSLVRLTPNSAVNLSLLGMDSAGNFETEISLESGLAYAELRAAPKYSYRLDARGAVISPVENATFRVNLDESPAEIAVLDGEVQVQYASGDSGVGYRTEVRAGETLRGDTEDTSRYFLAQEIAPDSWDGWNQDRDQAAADAAAQQTAARDSYAGDAGYGWSDLDANGSWYDVPGEGRVWQPNVAMDAGFDPYGNGNWVWYPGVGYVWASGYGWGWTPYRCGNWSYWSGFGWGWLPGNGCGFGGWGIAGGGYGGYGAGGGGFVVNVVQPPVGYRFPVRPVRTPGGGHPIGVHPGPGPVRPAPQRQVADRDGPVKIGDKMAEPLRPIRGVAVYGPTGREDGAVGASLRRDFPVDQASHQPVLGTPAGSRMPVQGARPIYRPGQGAERQGNDGRGMERQGADRQGTDRQGPERQGYGNGNGQGNGYGNGYGNGGRPTPGQLGTGRLSSGQGGQAERSGQSGAGQQMAPRPAAPQQAPAPRSAPPAPSAPAPQAAPAPHGGSSAPSGSSNSGGGGKGKS